MKYNEHNVGGHIHGGAKTQSVKGGFECREPYPLDTSDYDGGMGEAYGKSMSVAASGGAGGYRGGTEGGGNRKRGQSNGRAGLSNGGGDGGGGGSY